MITIGWVYTTLRYGTSFPNRGGRIPSESDKAGARELLEATYDRMMDLQDILKVMVETNEICCRMVRYAADELVAPEPLV